MTIRYAPADRQRIVRCDVTRIPDEADAETRALLEWVAEAKPPPLHGMSAPDARATFNERRQRTDLDPVSVARIEDRAIDGPAGLIPIRLYAPHGPADGALPTLVYYHGGGFVIGDLDSHDSVCRRIALGGDCLVMAVDYRLAPEHPYPAAAEDAIAALDWTVANATEIGGDPARLAVGGDSAGGKLAAVAAQHARDNDYRQVRLQALIYPAVDPVTPTDSRKRFADVFPIDRDTVAWFHRCYFPDHDRASEPWAAPGLVDDVSGLAPALILTAGLDPLVDEARLYADRLAAAGVPVAYHCFDGTVHGFLGMGKVLPHAEQAIDRVSAALRESFSAAAAA